MHPSDVSVTYAVNIHWKSTPNWTNVTASLHRGNFVRLRQISGFVLYNNSFMLHLKRAVILDNNWTPTAFIIISKCLLHQHSMVVFSTIYQYVCQYLSKASVHSEIAAKRLLGLPLRLSNAQHRKLWLFSLGFLPSHPIEVCSFFCPSAIVLEWSWGRRIKCVLIYFSLLHR